MITLSHISELRTLLDRERAAGRTIGFVPTMGALHEGHLSLIREAKRSSDIVVLSIFVNPAQFAPTEDLDRYPRDLQKDSLLAAEAGCDIIFVPTVQEMYPRGFGTYVIVEGLSSTLEGEFRPTHFRGVTTVVLKLLNIVQPRTAYFGQKDVQQSIIIRKMVQELDLPVTVRVVPTVREADGLAMSSRNVYLDPDQRRNAVALVRALALAATSIETGERESAAIIAAMHALIEQHHPTAIDYIRIVDADDLSDKHTLKSGDSIVIPLAVRFGTTRLIDNIILTVQ